MSHPHIPFDPTLPVDDPIAAAAEHQAELDEAWDAGYSQAESDRRWRVAGLLLAALSGAVLATFVTLTVVHAAAPRSGTPVEVLEAEASRQGPAQAGRVGAGVEPGTAIEAGTLAFSDPGLGDRYLAIPSGPGQRVRICAGSGTVSRCLDRTSTDAGPALFEQRAGRIADVSFVDFAWLCRCDPRVVGLLRGSIEWLDGPALTAPPTDVGP